MPEGLAGARESRHHRPNRDPDYLGQLTIGQPIELTEYEQLLKVIGESPERPLHRRRFVDLKQQRFRIRLWSRTAVLHFIERVRRPREAVTAPAVAGVADDSEEPGSPIPSGKRLEVSKRPERRLLH